MALAEGDPILNIRAYTLGGSPGAKIVFGTGNATTLYNQGVTNAPNPDLLLEVAPGTSNLLGKQVCLGNMPPPTDQGGAESVGVVIAVLQMANAGGGDDPLFETALVQTASGYRYLALVTVLTVVNEVA